MFRVRLPSPIMTKVASTASGIDRPMMKVLRRLPRKSSTTSIASVAPMSAALRTPPTALRMKNDWSETIS